MSDKTPMELLDEELVGGHFSDCNTNGPRHRSNRGCSCNAPDLRASITAMQAEVKRLRDALEKSEDYVTDLESDLRNKRGHP